MVRTLWDESASYEVLIPGDEGVSRAIHALLDNQSFVRVEGTVSLTPTSNEVNENNEEHGL